MTRPDRLRWVLENRRARRLLVETAVVFVGAFTVFAVWIGPTLQSVAPGVFARAPVDTGPYELPKTALGWAHLFVVGTATLGYLYYRLYRTEMRRSVSAAFRDRTAERRRD
ncbi:hypothetical protein [Halorientalis halophila]|uniref:hypothetical protein n=1 Tax=Halorientalis halophila TaxID=3108499 RepID=UPI00300A1DE2